MFLQPSLRLKRFLLSVMPVVILLLTVITPYAQELSIIPAPVHIQKNTGSFSLTGSTPIIVPPGNAEVKRLASYLSAQLQSLTQRELKTTESGAAGIRLQLLNTADPPLGTEGYRLNVTNTLVHISANQPAGLFYGIQSLLQLVPYTGKAEGTTVAIPAITITDYPRFGWRGIMLDVSRHFFPKDYVKQYIDQLATFKFNRLHLHLTDDNGWRIEIKSLPKLTEVGAWRVPRTGTFGSNAPPKPGEKATYGGYYTHDDIRELVHYAKERYIEILPEIDVPGHSMAALAAYPELCVTKDTSIRVNPGTAFSTWFGNGKFEMHIDNTLNPTDEKVYQFLDKVFTEVAMLFPFEYIHMGGDECYKGYWERDASVRAFMKKNNIKDSEALQAYFTSRVSKILASKGKKMIGWDEILEGGLVPGAAVMSWRGTKGGIEASHKKHPVVMSPAPTYYLDMMQGDAAVEAPVYSTARLKDVYAFDILPKEIDSAYVLGGQGNLWTEQVPTVAQAEYMTYPRALAIAETLWTPKTKKDWNNFISRVETQFTRFDQAKINYATSLYDPIITVRKDKNNRLVVQLATEVDGLDLYYTMDNAIPNHYHTRYKEPVVLSEDVDLFRVIAYRNGKPVGRLITLKAEDLQKRVKK